MTSATPSTRRRGLLLSLGVAELLVVMNVTLFFPAFDGARASFGPANVDRFWFVTTFTLVFGSLLLVGGRLVDRLGQRTSLIVGFTGFAAASTVGGVASSFSMLLAARASQGACGALLAPATVATLSRTFTVATTRARAFSLLGALTGSGAALGLLAGALLTHWLSWRWCLLASVVLAAVGLAGVVRYLRARDDVRRTPLDVPGALLATAGLFCLFYGCARAIRSLSVPWRHEDVWVSLGLGIVLLVGYGWWQMRVAAPLVPRQLLRSRNRVGSIVALFAANFAGFIAVLFLAHYLEAQLGLSAVATGVAFLPLVGAIAVSASIASARLLPVTGPRALVPSGMLLGVMGMVLMTRLPVTNQYFTHVMPGLIVTGLGVGLIVAPATSTLMSGARLGDGGVAGGVAGTSQQVGAISGATILSAVALLASSDTDSLHVAAPAPSAVGLSASVSLSGVTAAFWWAAVVFAAGTVVTAILLESGVPAYGDDLDVAVA